MAETLTFYHASPLEYESSILAKGIVASGAERYKVIEKDILGVFGVVNMEEAREKLGRNTLIKLNKVLDGAANRFASTSDVIYVAGDWTYAAQNCLAGYEVYGNIKTWFPKRRLPQEPVGKFSRGVAPTDFPPPQTLAEARAMGDSVEGWPVCTLYVIEVPVAELPVNKMAKLYDFIDRTLAGEEDMLSMFYDISDRSQHELYGNLPYKERVKNIWKAAYLREVRVERNRIPKSWVKSHFRIPFLGGVEWSVRRE